MKKAKAWAKVFRKKHQKKSKREFRQWLNK